MNSPMCRYGLTMQAQQPSNPKPLSMSVPDQLALFEALCSGHECWLEWGTPVKTTETRRVRLGKKCLFEFLDVDTGWRALSMPASRWVSWSRVKKPQVWEGETDVSAPMDSSAVLVFPAKGVKSGTRVRYRIEEAL